MLLKELNRATFKLQTFATIVRSSFYEWDLAFIYLESFHGVRYLCSAQPSAVNFHQLYDISERQYQCQIINLFQSALLEKRISKLLPLGWE